MNLDTIVKVINRVVDEDGKPVPYDAHVAGECITIVDSVSLPEGMARIIVHNSMYEMDPFGFQGKYKLGVKEWGIPVDPIKKSELDARVELIEREALTPDRQFGFKNKDGKQYQPKRISNPIRRQEPLAVNMPGRQDGAFPGTYGENQ